MRQAGFIAVALLVIACGPDPNAQLPGVAQPTTTGGASGFGGAVGTGGHTESTSSGGATTIPEGTGGKSTGGASGSGAGGVISSGGIVGSGGKASGGAMGSGGASGSGGAVVGRDGGAVDVPVSGGSDGGPTTYTWGVGPEPCASPKDISCAVGSGNTQNFDSTTEFCFRTADVIEGWSCNNLDGWTMKINGQVVACTSGIVPSGTIPPALNGLYYFDFIGSASAKSWASLSWYAANPAGCKAPPYPSWSGDTAPNPGDAGASSGGG
jgi:hypothetical protein